MKFETIADATTAKERLDKLEVDGRVINCCFAKNRRELKRERAEKRKKGKK